MDQIYKQAIQLQFKFRDYVDQPNNPAMVNLRDQIQALTDDIEMKKNKLSLEDRVKTIIRILDSADGSGGMDDNHVDDLKDRSNDLRNDIRNLK